MLEVTKTQFIGFDFGFCAICDNHTPRQYIPEADEEGCLICWEAYGEVHQVKCLTPVLVSKQLERIDKWIPDTAN